MVYHAGLYAVGYPGQYELIYDNTDPELSGYVAGDAFQQDRGRPWYGYVRKDGDRIEVGKAKTLRKVMEIVAAAAN